MRSTTRVTTLVVALATLFAAFAATATAAPAATKPHTGSITEQVTGTLDDGRTFAGSLDVTRFTRQGQQIVAVGTVTGTITDATGAIAPQTVPATAVQVPVDLATTRAAAQATAGCEILDLVLGPLDLNLLGLVVHLDTVHLNITAVPGAGNLLGNLLCAVAGLLDGPGPLAGLLNSLTALLNQILGALG
jgi:hypothetical protein